VAYLFDQWSLNARVYSPDDTGPISKEPSAAVKTGSSQE
jgi:hypothetical protein